ncbi:sulfotransferase family protein [Rhodobacteraceae bacterium]|nr:sulfotransferase family protein [Paracoccaceae bacterium]
MLIFWEQRLVFLATPKTASTAVQAALEPLASVAMQRPDPLKHMSAQDFYRSLAPYLEACTNDHFTTVALIRHPIEWLRSWYRFLQRDNFDDPTHPMRGRSFEDFANDYMAQDCPQHARLSSQSDYLTDAAGTLLVDQLYRYEEIGQFVRFLEDRLLFEITLPRINVPPAVETHLSASTQDRLRSFMAQDFALYEHVANV